MEKDVLNLAWRDADGNRHIVGELMKTEDGYFFKYDLDGVKKASAYGFVPLMPFPQLNATYENRFLFPVFSSRLPDKRRPDLQKILDTYNLSSYEPFELLKSSGGRLPIDKFEFVSR